MSPIWNCNFYIKSHFSFLYHSFLFLSDQKQNFHFPSCLDSMWHFKGLLLLFHTKIYFHEYPCGVFSGISYTLLHDQNFHKEAVSWTLHYHDCFCHTSNDFWLWNFSLQLWHWNQTFKIKSHLGFYFWLFHLDL